MQPACLTTGHVPGFGAPLGRKSIWYHAGSLPSIHGESNTCSLRGSATLFAKKDLIMSGDPLLLETGAPEQTLGLLLDAAPDATIVVDGSGSMTLVNSQTEHLFGFKREELLGRPIEMLVPERFRKRHEGHRSTYGRAPRTREMGAGFELYGLRRDGTEFPVEISLSPIRMGEKTYVVSAIRDVTDRRRIEQALREANLELERASLTKDNFLASMSHELRTPLNAIIGFTGTLLMKLPGPLTEEQERQLRTIQSSGRHLLSLINDILDLAKVESGKIELHFEPVYVREALDEVTTALEPLARAKGLAFDVELPAERISVRTDRRALQQIILNLTNNAIKYTERGGVRIAIVFREERGRRMLDVVVSDTGVGIKPDDVTRLFTAFEQIDSSTTRKFEGTGLGLHLSKRLAALLGAEISVQSEYGAGSTFTLSLPAGVRS
jgi:PAS domain S-box-containing protein